MVEEGDSLLWKVYADQLTSQISSGRNRRVNSLCLPGNIRVLRTNDDTSMIGPLTMKANEVTAVQSQYCSTFTGCVRQDVNVWDSLVRLSNSNGGYHVVAVCAQGQHELA